MYYSSITIFFPYQFLNLHFTFSRKLVKPKSYVCYKLFLELNKDKLTEIV